MSNLIHLQNPIFGDVFLLCIEANQKRYFEFGDVQTRDRQICLLDANVGLIFDVVRDVGVLRPILKLSVFVAQMLKI